RIRSLGKISNYLCRANSNPHAAAQLALQLLLGGLLGSGCELLLRCSQRLESGFGLPAEHLAPVTDSLLLPIVTANLWRASLLLAAVAARSCQLALLSDFCRLGAAPAPAGLSVLPALAVCSSDCSAPPPGCCARRKWNPLRLRAGQCALQLDQLLLCTLAF
uniref:ABC transmembrane type-1 domain-containing protein n=1 Tax=Macrostomum lignano TaxID=282301 RepID=A0A1I8FBC6_9PLAT